jgi:hypothetical protein
MGLVLVLVLGLGMGWGRVRAVVLLVAVLVVVSVGGMCLIMGLDGVAGAMASWNRTSTRITLRRHGRCRGRRRLIRGMVVEAVGRILLLLMGRGMGMDIPVLEVVEVGGMGHPLAATITATVGAFTNSTIITEAGAAVLLRRPSQPKSRLHFLHRPAPPPVAVQVTWA